MINEDKRNSLVWIDLETTGLNPATCAIIEIAVFVTTGDLDEVAEPIFRHCYPRLIYRYGEPRAIDIAVMDDAARKMHEASGLLDECRIHDGRGTLRETEDVVLAYLHEHTDPGACPLAGSSVHFDRAFLARWMPRVHAYLHYRNFDVSVLHMAAMAWAPELAERAPEKRGIHRALPDLEDSLKIARYYRDAMRAGQEARRRLGDMMFDYRESLL